MLSRIAWNTVVGVGVGVGEDVAHGNADPPSKFGSGKHPKPLAQRRPTGKKPSCSPPRPAIPLRQHPRRKLILHYRSDRSDPSRPDTHWVRCLGIPSVRPHNIKAILADHSHLECGLLLFPDLKPRSLEFEEKDSYMT